MSHGDAAAATRTCRGPERRVAATPRLPRGSSEGASRGDAAAADVDRPRAARAGDLGYPQWVHRLAGLGEAGVVGLRVFALVERSEVPRALATVLTGPMLGGAAFTWLYVLQKPRHGTPALLVFLATWFTRSRKIRATAECYSITIVFGACAAALIRWRTGPRKKRKKKTAAKEE